MEEKKLVTKDEIMKEVDKKAKEAMHKSVASTIRLSDYFTTTTDTEQRLPELTMWGIILMERVVGELGNLNLSNENVTKILWCLLNQDNEDILNWDKKQIEASLFQFSKDIKYSEFRKYTEAVSKVFNLEEEDESGNVPQAQEEKAVKTT